MLHQRSAQAYPRPQSPPPSRKMIHLLRSCAVAYLRTNIAAGVPSLQIALGYSERSISIRKRSLPGVTSSVPPMVPQVNACAILSGSLAALDAVTGDKQEVQTITISTRWMN